MINDSWVLMVNPSDLAGGQISPANLFRGPARMTKLLSRFFSIGLTGLRIGSANYYPSRELFFFKKG